MLNTIMYQRLNKDKYDYFTQYSFDVKSRF